MSPWPGDSITACLWHPIVNKAIRPGLQHVGNIRSPKPKGRCGLHKVLGMKLQESQARRNIETLNGPKTPHHSEDLLVLGLNPGMFSDNLQDEGCILDSPKTILHDNIISPVTTQNIMFDSMYICPWLDTELDGYTTHNATNQKNTVDLYTHRNRQAEDGRPQH